MQKIKKKVTGYLGRGIAVVLALMLVALPCLSFPAMAAVDSEPVYLAELVDPNGNSETLRELVLPLLDFVGPPQFSPSSDLSSFSTLHFGIFGVPDFLLGKYFIYKLVLPFDFIGPISSDEVNQVIHELVLPMFQSYLKGIASPYIDSPLEDVLALSVVSSLERYVLNSNSLDVYIKVSFDVIPGYAIYILDFIYVPGLSLYLEEIPNAPTFSGSVGESITGVLGWVGTVISSIVTPGGALYTLLPLFVLGISIAVIFVAYKIIRAYVWGV